MRLFCSVFLLQVFSTFFIWLLFGISLAVTMVASDSCVWLGDSETRLPERFNEHTATVLTTCLVNTSMTDALNLTSYLNFTKIAFPTLNVSQAFNFTQFTRFESEVAALTPSTFGYSSSNRTAAVHQLVRAFIHIHHAYYVLILCSCGVVCRIPSLAHRPILTLPII
jgi:hypothetical protein